MGSFTSCALLTVICSLLFLAVPTSADDTLPRRTSLDFQGRNRGSVTDVPPPASTSSALSKADDQQQQQQQQQQPITSPVASNDASDYIRGLPILSLVKRAPVGFMGMRGKKESEMVTYDDPILDQETSRDKKLFLNLPFRYIPKRAPSGFMGMRGKKFYFDSYKRAPSGFLGMRGKKESEHIWPPIDDIQQNDQDEISSELPEDEQLDEIYTELDQERELLARLSEMYGLHLWDDNKRAPANGFFGMRGKKDDDSTNKRAPMGFQGMRGKKWVDESADGEEVDKRAPQMGFHGMRGKKDVSDVLLGESAEKRAPSAGFFGMRGKKQPGYRRITADRRNLFGYMKSKKGPYEFRGKFVGVRGKKIPVESELNQLLMELDENQPDGWLDAPQLIPVAEEAPIKRVPSGFMGMRGKKWSEASSDEQ